jgi:hypothetical protein
MAMKRHEALEAVRRALAQQRRSGAVKVGFVVPEREPASALVPPEPRAPEFEFSGWQFFALTGAFEDEPLNDGGDATLRAPDGTYIGLVWGATGKLAHRFDFASMQMPVLYVDVPGAVASWAELRPHFEALAPALEAELRAHGHLTIVGGGREAQ